MPGRGRWWDHWPQVVLVSAAVGVYFMTRGLTESDPARALRNADQLISFERVTHLYQEPRLQALVVDHDRVVTLLNWIYIWLHWPVIVAVLIWLVRSHPEPYRLLRNAMFVSGVIGLVVFALYPVAPPRLAGLGLTDTVTSHSHSYRVLQPPAFVNQYAALPSLHVGWNLLLGISLVRHGRHLALRVFGLLSPVAMAVAVVLTANHYVIDVVVGVLVALVGLALAARLTRHVRKPRVLTACLVASVVACGSPQADSLRPATLYLPSARGPATVVVLVPGGGWRTADPAGLVSLAQDLARSGFVAATISYRAAAVGAHFPVPVADVLCGAASAVAQAAAGGRSGGSVVLLGHSAGGQLAVLAALRPDAFRSNCPDPPVTPAGVVALAGAFQLDGIAQDLFGATKSERPDQWRDGDVFAWVHERPQLPVLLVHGTDDQLVPVAWTAGLAGDLHAAGHPVRTELVTGATHDTVYHSDVVLPVVKEWLATTFPVVRPGEGRTPCATGGVVRPGRLIL
jgi:acetyl esterase/lipase